MTMQDLLAMFDIPTTFMTPEEEAYLLEQQAIAAAALAQPWDPYQNQITPPSLPGAGMVEGRPQAVINPQYDVPVSAAPDPYAQYTSGANDIAMQAAEQARLAQMGSAPAETFDYGTELQNYATQNYGDLPTMGPPAGGAFATVGGSGRAYSDSSGATGTAPGFLLGPMLGLTPQMRQAGIESEQEDRGILGTFLDNLSNLPLLSFPTGGTTQGSPRGTVNLGDAAGAAYDAYMYDIPVVSDFMRETVQPFVGDVGAYLGGQAAEMLTPKFADPALDALTQILLGPGVTPKDIGSDVGRLGGEAVVPVTAGDFALELIPGIGTIPDLARIAPDIARQAARGLDAAALRALGDKVVTVYHIPSSDEGLESILRTGLNPGTAVTTDRELAEAISERWGFDILEFKAPADSLVADAYYQRTTTPLQVGGTGAEGALGRLVGAEQGSMTVSGGRTSVGGSLQRQTHELREVAPEATQEMNYLGEGLSLNPKALGIADDLDAQLAAVKANRKGKTAQLGKLEAQAAVAKVIDESNNASHAYNTILSMARNAGGPLPRDRAYRDELGRIVNDIIDIDDDLSIAFKPDVLAPASASPPPPDPPAPAQAGMTPKAVSAVRRRRKGGTEIPVTQDPMAPAAGGRGRKPPAGGVATAEPPSPPPPTGTGATPTDDFAGNIRLSKYPDDIRDTIKGWADANPDVVQNARRGTLPDEQVEQMARELVNDLGGDFNKVQAGWKPGQAWSAEEIVAIRGSLNDATRRVMDAAELARTADTTANQLKLTEAILEQQRIQQIVHGVTAEAGRSLRAFRRQAAEAMADNNLARMQELMRHALKANSDQDVANLTEMIRALDIEDPVAVNTFLRNVNKPGVGDYLYELWINSVLSGPVTHLRNIFGNAAATMYSPVERLGAVPVESIAARIQGRQAQRFWQEAPASVLGMAMGVPDGVRGAIDVMRHGFNPNDVGRLEIRRQAFTGVPGRVIRFPTNALEAMDAFFHSVNYRSSLYADAVRQARREGLSDVALRNRIAELIHNPTVQMIKHSSDEAERLLFRSDPGQFATKLMSLRESTPGLKYVIPFVRTPANLLKYGVKHSPLGLLDVPMWKRLLAKNPEASDEVSRVLMGTMVGLGINTMIATGQLDITGAVPVDAAERDRFYREGKLPFSVKIPGIGWVQYNQIPILDTTLTSVASLADGIRKGQDVTGIASNTAGIIAQSILDKSYLNGLADFFDAISDPARYAERFATRTITGFVPFSAALRQTAQSIDRTVRTPEGLVENLQAGIPGLTGNVPARLDAFGNEAQRGQPSPLQISPDKQSAIDAELEQVGVEIGFVGDSIGGVGLNREQQSLYQKAAGERTAAALDALISDPRYQALSTQQKAEAIQKQRDMARTSVRTPFNQMIDSDVYKNATPEQQVQYVTELLRWLDQGWEPGEATPKTNLAEQSATTMIDLNVDESRPGGKLLPLFNPDPREGEEGRANVAAGTLFTDPVSGASIYRNAYDQYEVRLPDGRVIPVTESAMRFLGDDEGRGTPYLQALIDGVLGAWGAPGLAYPRTPAERSY